MATGTCKPLAQSASAVNDPSTGTAQGEVGPSGARTVKVFSYVRVVSWVQWNPRSGDRTEGVHLPAGDSGRDAERRWSSV